MHLEELAKFLPVFQPEIARPQPNPVSRLPTVIIIGCARACRGSPNRFGIEPLPRTTPSILAQTLSMTDATLYRQLCNVLAMYLHTQFL